MHPDTRIMAPTARNTAKLPGAPVKPLYPMPKGTVSIEDSIAMIPATQPIAIAMNDVTTVPSNITVGVTSYLVFKDPQSGEIRVFDRRVEADLTLKFRLNDKPGRHAWLVDDDTNTGWDSRGVALDGEWGKTKKRLKALEVQGDLPWGVIKHWWPGLKMVTR